MYVKLPTQPVEVDTCCHPWKKNVNTDAPPHVPPVRWMVNVLPLRLSGAKVVGVGAVGCKFVMASPSPSQPVISNRQTPTAVYCLKSMALLPLKLGFGSITIVIGAVDTPWRSFGGCPGASVVRLSQATYDLSVFPAHVLESVALDSARRERQHPVPTVERLNGGLLVDAEHCGTTGRVRRDR